jgi:hypothetical protein
VTVARTPAARHIGMLDLATAALADALGLEVLFHANELDRNFATGLAQRPDAGLDNGEACARVIRQFDLRIQIGDLALHLL